MKPVLLIAFAAAFAAPAWAQDIPRYDPITHCDEVAALNGTRSESLYGSCLDMEQDAYDSLKTAWVNLPTNMQRHCDEVATFGGQGSYSLLQSCVKMELDAREKSSDRQFQF